MTYSRINQQLQPPLLLNLKLPQLPLLNWSKLLQHQHLPLLLKKNPKKYNLAKKSTCSSTKNQLPKKSPNPNTYLSTILLLVSNQLLPKRRPHYQSQLIKSRNKLSMSKPEVPQIKLQLKLYPSLQMPLRNNLLPLLKRHQRRKLFLQSLLLLLHQQFQ